ncbi:MAG: HAD hydrolase-like protein [Nitrososphaerota archaeon]
MKGKIKANLILFDLGDIFFNAHKWRMWLYQELKRKYKISGNFRDFYLNFEDKMKNVYLGKIKYKSALINLMKDYGVKNLYEFYNESISIKNDYEAKRRLYKGVKQTIEILKKRQKKLIIVSDNEKSGDILYSFYCNKYSFFKNIDSFISSIDIGVTKSEKEFFEKVLKLLKFKYNVTVFIGHDKDEIESAQTLNIQTIVFNNYLKYNFINTIHISKFEYLQNIIE